VRLLLVNQFYPPDIAPTGQLLHDLARSLLARGHVVDVLSSRRAYQGGVRHPAFEEREGVRVHRVGAPLEGPRRLAGRMADQLAFLGLGLVRAARLPRPDLVLALTSPPFVGALAKLLGRWRGAAHAHWVMDVYPEVLAAHGVVPRASRRYRTLVRLARWQLAGAARVIALGPSMVVRLASYLDEPPEWVALWGDDRDADEEAARLRRERGWSPDETVLLYSGHMGLAHRMGELLEAARRLGPQGPRWVFAGGGPRRREVESFAAAHPGARVELLPYVAREQLPASLAAADVHLASLALGWQGIVAPSKVQAAFCAGRPVVFVGPPDNESAAWVAESGGGWLVAEGDVDGLLAAVAQACEPGERAARAARALRFARSHFDRARNCERIAVLLEGCVLAPGAP
jgi:glycosyltransferase involved in cell wall biosynthesis